MPSYRRGSGSGVEVWMVERRGQTLWFRQGRGGSKGRVTHEQHGSESEAERALADAVALRLAEGWSLVDANARIDARPLRASVSAGSRHAKRPARAGLRQLADMLDRRLSATSPLDARTAQTMLFEVVATPTWERLRGFAFDLDASGVTLVVTFMEGEGDNIDGYDCESIELDLELPVPSDVFPDGLECDVFADDLRREPGTKLLQRFRAALDGDPSWNAVASLPVSRFEVALRDW